MADPHSWGLLGFGTYGDWEIEVDELLDSDETLFGVSLRHPMIYVHFNITSLAVLNRLIDFLDTMDSKNYEFEIEGLSGRSLCFVFDEERLFIRAISGWGSGRPEVFKVRVSDDDTASLAKALKDARDDI